MASCNRFRTWSLHSWWMQLVQLMLVVKVKKMKKMLARKKSECFDLVMFSLCGRDSKLFEAVAVVSTISETGPPVLNSFVLLLVPPADVEMDSPLEITAI